MPDFQKITVDRQVYTLAPASFGGSLIWDEDGNEFFRSPAHQPDLTPEIATLLISEKVKSFKQGVEVGKADLALQLRRLLRAADGNFT